MTDVIGRPKLPATLTVILAALCCASPAAAQICAPSNRSCTTFYEACQRLCEQDKQPDACVALKCEASAKNCRTSGRWISHDQKACVATTDRR